MPEKMPAFRALVSFMDIREGDVSVMPLDATVQGWLNAGFVERVGDAEIFVEDTGPAEVTLSVGEVSTDGPDPAGQSGPEPHDAGRKPGRRRRP